MIQEFIIYTARVYMNGWSQEHNIKSHKKTMRNILNPFDLISEFFLDHVIYEKSSVKFSFLKNYTVEI